MLGGAAGRWVQGDYDVRRLCLRRDQLPIARANRPEAIPDHDGGRTRVGPCAQGRGRGLGQRLWIDPAAARTGGPGPQLAPIGPVDPRQRAQGGIPRSLGRSGELGRPDLVGKQGSNRLGDQVGEAARRGDRPEVARPPAANLAIGDPAQELSADVDGHELAGADDVAGVGGGRLDVEREGNAAALNQAAAELVGVSGRGDEHEGGRERIPLVALGQECNEVFGLAAPGRATNDR